MEDRLHAESSKSRGRCRRLDVTAVGHGGVEQTTWSVQCRRRGLQSADLQYGPAVIDDVSAQSISRAVPHPAPPRRP